MYRASTYSTNFSIYSYVKATVAIAQRFSLGDFDREAFQAPPTLDLASINPHVRTKQRMG